MFLAERPNTYQLAGRQAGDRHFKFHDERDNLRSVVDEPGTFGRLAAVADDCDVTEPPDTPALAQFPVDGLMEVVDGLKQVCNDREGGGAGETAAPEGRPAGRRGADRGLRPGPRLQCLGTAAHQTTPGPLRRGKGCDTASGPTRRAS